MQVPEDLWTQIQHDAVGASSGNGSTDSPKRRSEQAVTQPIASNSSLSKTYSEEVIVDPSMMQHHGNIDLSHRLESDSIVSQLPELEEVRPEAVDPFWVFSQVTGASLLNNMAVSSFGSGFLPNNVVAPMQISSVSNAVPMFPSSLNSLTSLQQGVIPGQANQLYQTGAPMLSYQPVVFANQQGQPQQYSFIPVATTDTSSAMMPPQSSTLLEAITAVTRSSPQAMPATTSGNFGTLSSSASSLSNALGSQPLTHETIAKAVCMQQQSTPSLVSSASSLSSSPSSSTSSIRFNPYRASPERYLQKSMDLGENESVPLLQSAAAQRFQRARGQSDPVRYNTQAIAQAGTSTADSSFAWGTNDTWFGQQEGSSNTEATPTLDSIMPQYIPPRQLGIQGHTRINTSNAAAVDPHPTLSAVMESFVLPSPVSTSPSTTFPRLQSTSSYDVSGAASPISTPSDLVMDDCMSALDSPAYSTVHDDNFILPAFNLQSTWSHSRFHTR